MNILTKQPRFVLSLFIAAKIPKKVLTQLPTTGYKKFALAGGYGALNNLMTATEENKDIAKLMLK
jgi:hypothetical protein